MKLEAPLLDEQTALGVEKPWISIPERNKYLGCLSGAFVPLVSCLIMARQLECPVSPVFSELPVAVVEIHCSLLGLGPGARPLQRLPTGVETSSSPCAICFRPSKVTIWQRQRSRKSRVIVR